MNQKNFVPREKTDFGKKLQDATRGMKHTKKVTSRDPLPAPSESGVDGEEHINIWEFGATALGRDLSHSGNLPIEHEIFGNFSNMEAFWYYIRSTERDDRIRTMRGRQLKQFAEKLTSVRVPNFCAIIMDSNWQKIKQHPAVLESLKESTLPFDCYFTYKRTDGVRIRPSFSYWLIDGFNEIRAALKEGREPNFDAFKNNKSIGIYDSALNVKQKPKKKPAPQKKEVFSDSDASEVAALMQAATQQG